MVVGRGCRCLVVGCVLVAAGGEGCPQFVPKALGGAAEYAGMNSPPSTFESDEETSEPSRAEAQTSAFWL